MFQLGDKTVFELVLEALLIVNGLGVEGRERLMHPVLFSEEIVSNKISLFANGKRNKRSRAKEKHS